MSPRAFAKIDFIAKTPPGYREHEFWQFWQFWHNRFGPSLGVRSTKRTPPL